MDDDPWGSAKDPWSTSTDDVIPNEGAVPAGQTIVRLPTPTFNVPLTASSTAADFVEDDPWSRPSDKTPSPVPAIQSTLPKDTTQISDVPTPAKWNLEEPADYNTWSTSEDVPEQPPRPPEITQSGGRAPQLSPVQIPLPVADNEDLDVAQPVEVEAKVIAEAGWKTTEEEESQLDVPDLPTLPEISRPLVVEDETFNPFSQDERAPNPIPEKPVEGFTRSSFDDDAFGGFSAGVDDGFQTGAGFGSSKEGDINQGWGNQEDDSSISGIDAPWGTSSNTNNIPPEDDEEGFQSSSAAYGHSIIKAASANDEDGFHSVPSKEREAASAEKLKQDEWEAARREIEMKEARAPSEMVNKLVNQWKDVMEQVFPPSATLDIGKDVEDGMDMETTIRQDRNMARLTELPAGFSISFQPVINTVTWERYQDYVSNVKLDPSSSILAKASAEYSYRINKRKSQEQHDAWQSRSRLGENRELDLSSQQQSALSPDSDTGRSRWSFWGRKASTPTVPLMTSGGGMLEIKNLDLLSAANTSLDKPGPHIGDRRTSSPMTAHLTPPSSSGINPGKTNPTPQPEADTPDAHPSAVGRFFGKLRRTRPQSPSVDINNKDMELTQDDFSFLAEVPSLAPKPDQAFGDLLSLNGDGRPSEQLSSLEAMLNSKPMPLPSKLEPPHRPSALRGSSTHSAGAAVPVSKSSSMMDLFGDLDLNATAASSSIAHPPAGISPFGTSFTTNQATNAAIQSPYQSPPIPPPLPRAGPVGNSAALNPAPLVKATTFDSDGFGDFAASSHGAAPKATAGAQSFDDFGDFEQFATVPAKPSSQTYSAQRSPSNASTHDFNPYFTNRVSTRPVKSVSSRLDHTPTAHLVSEAARNTRHWPAPPSPSVPALPPPTSSRNMTTFPSAQLAAPTSASSSRASTPLNFDFLSGDPPTLSSARGDPSSKQSAIINNIQPLSQLSKGQGLTASDLSFFDSL